MTNTDRLNAWVRQCTSAPERGIDRAEVRRALSIFIDPEQTFCLQSLPSARWQVCSGSDLDAAVEAAFELSDGTGVYWTLNPCRPGLAKMPVNGDIVGRRWLLIDIDRRTWKIPGATDTNATEAEKLLVTGVAYKASDWLYELGWPNPVMVDSGNGNHLYYRVDLPNDPLSRAILKAVLTELKHRFDTPQAEIDGKVIDARRITKLPGTWARKGPHSDDRPHRLARLVMVPDEIEAVSLELLQAAGGRPDVVPPDTRAQDNGAVPHGATAFVARSVRGGLNLTNYVRRAIELECAHVEMAGSEGRNNALNVAAHSLGTMAGWPEMNALEAREALRIAACRSGLDTDPNCGPLGIARTIESGWSTGVTKPRPWPEPGQPTSKPVGPPTTVPPGMPNLTELGNAHRLIARHGERIRFAKPLGMWFIWDGTRWRPDDTEEIFRLAKDAVRMIGREASEVDDSSLRNATLRWALQSEQKKVITAMIDLARSEPGTAIMPDDLDRDPWLMTCKNGTIDLHTGKLREHRQADQISKRTSVACGGNCPKWLDALHTILAGDPELIAYVQRALGYSLTGSIGEHALFLCYGTGRNGKNTILDTARTIMGDYATITNPRVFLVDGQGDHPAALANLMGRRFVPTSEVEEGEKLAESLVKRVTGDRTLKARFMRQNPFEFPVLFKLWMLANCKPEIHGRDEGIWSRIRIIPFDVFISPDKRIKNYSDILVQQEGPGILQWMVEGCLEWQRIGLAEPARVTEAVSDYRAEQDSFGDYLDQHCDQFDQGRVKVGKLYEDYTHWCKDNGEKSVLTNRKFGAEMNRRGFKLWESNGTRYRLGIALKSDHDDSSKGSPFKSSAY